ncbi:MAG: hypothetical protein AB7N24_09850 [Dehalococcoidia bacterium]
MRILRLAASDEAPGRLPAGASIPEIIASIVEAETGEPVEIKLRAAWPSDALPGLIGRWLDEYEPDIVFLKVNAYWFNYLSLPLQIERKFGKAGRPINRIGKQVGELRPVSSSRPYRIARRYLLRVFPGATYFTPEAVVASMQECVRTVLAREGIGLVVSGPASRLNHELSSKAARAHEARRQLVHQSMKRFCAEVHVPYFGMDRVPTKGELAATVGSDGLHVNESASRRLAEEEAEALVTLWRTIHEQGNVHRS